MGNNLISDLTVFQGVGIISVVYSVLQIVYNNRMGERIKRALLWSCLLSGLVIFGQTLYFIAVDLFPDDIVLTVLASLKYIILAFFPIVVLSALERETYIHSRTNAVLIIIIGGYYMSLILNYFLPIFFTIDENGCFYKEPFFFMHSIVMFIIYTLSFTILFQKKYTISFQEVAGLITLMMIFFFAIFCTDVDFHPGVIEMLCGIAVLVLTNMFQALESKICPVCTLPYIRNLLNDKSILRKKVQSRVCVFTLVDLKFYNENFGREWGDSYFYSVTKTIADKLKPYGSLYRCNGDKILFIGKDIVQLNDVVKDINEIKITDAKYDKYDFEVTIDSHICNENNIYDTLKKYA